MAYSKPPVPYSQYAGGPLWFNFQFSGKRQKIATGTRNMAEARLMAKRTWEEARARAKIDDLAAGKIVGRAKDMPLDIAIGKFWLGRVVAENQKGQKDIRRRLDKLNKLLGKDTLISTIDDDVLQEFKDARAAIISARTGLPLSKVTRNGEIADLQNVLNFCHTTLKVPLPIIDWKRFKFKKSELNKRDRVLEPAEVNRVLADIRPDYRPIIDFMLCTGMRRASVVNFTWANVIWHLDTISYVQKGDRAFSHPLTADVRAILEGEQAHGFQGENVFTFVAAKTKTDPRSGKRYVKGQRYPITYHTLMTVWRRLCNRIGIPNATLHDLRKTFGSYAYAAIDLKIVSKLSGHANQEITEECYAFLPSKEVVAGAHAASVYRQSLRTEAMRLVEVVANQPANHLIAANDA